jgi:O-Antigen ligase
MNIAPLAIVPATSARQQRRRQRRTWWLGYLSVFTLGLMVAGMAWKRSYQQQFGLALAALVITLAAWAIRPIVALHLTLFFALIGDAVTISWFPFNKNLSSRESILYFADDVTISPLEVVLVFAVMATLLRNVSTTGRLLRPGPMLRPLLIFSALVGFGFANGMASGGDLRVAIFEMRPLLYIAMVYILATNVCEHSHQYRYLMWTAMSAVFVQSLFSLHYLTGLSQPARDNLESLTEHGSSIGMNVFIILLFAALAFRGVSGITRLILLAGAIPVGWVYLLSQRRAAVIGLGAAIVLFFVLLHQRQRRTFWKVAPVVGIAVVGYLGAFWNSTSDAGFPAQAVKTVIAPDQVSAKDQSSDLYRKIENFDLSITIRSAPVTGLGFGQKFLRPVPLPDISNFEFYEYIPHNSMLWIWIKTGFAGFVAVFYMFGRSIMLGVAKLKRMTYPTDLLAHTGALLFLVTYAIYTYVDIAFDARNTVFLGFAIAMSTSVVKSSTPDDEEIQPVPSSARLVPLREYAGGNV